MIQWLMFIKNENMNLTLNQINSGKKSHKVYQTGSHKARWTESHKHSQTFFLDDFQELFLEGG
jgi:hypothetical protein